MHVHIIHAHFIELIVLMCINCTDWTWAWTWDDYECARTAYICISSVYQNEIDYTAATTTTTTTTVESIVIMIV